MIIDTNTHPLSYIGNAYKELIRKLSDVQDERDLILKLVAIKDIPESTKDAMEQLEQLSQRMEFLDNDISSLKKRIKHAKKGKIRNVIRNNKKPR